MAAATAAKGKDVQLKHAARNSAQFLAVRGVPLGTV